MPEKKISWWKKAAVIIPIIFLSTWALAMWNPLEKEKPDNAFEVSGYTFFELPDGTYGTYILAGEKKLPIAFRLDPRNASAYYLQDGVVDRILSSAKVYITFNPNVQDYQLLAMAGVEISRITGLYGIPTVGAYTEDANPIDPNIPIRTCEDATNTITVIVIETGESNGISMKDGCVHVTAKSAEETIYVADKLGFNLLGIAV